jgi:hypothetical protein
VYHSSKKLGLVGTCSVLLGLEGVCRVDKFIWEELRERDSEEMLFGTIPSSK